MSTVDQLRDQVLTLPSHDRAALAAILLESLEPASSADDVEQAVLVEAESRAAAYARGELTASDVQESLERMRRTLVERPRP